MRPGERVRVALRVRCCAGRCGRCASRCACRAASRPARARCAWAGTPVEDTSVATSDALSILLELFGAGGGRAGAQSMAETVARFEATAPYDGVFALLGGRLRHAYRNPQVRIDGHASVDVVVKRPRHPTRHRAVGRILQTGS